ncbi:hypothetical protein PMAYCL1PPCAC_07033, partial [Pristionchus mayeri]
EMKSGQKPEVKKWKGKKKVKTLADKKAKGLHMNRVDRKKFAKEGVKKQFDDKIRKAVKHQLEELEERSVSSMSESSFGSQPPPKKKRVSFSSALEHHKLFDKKEMNLEIKASTASPGKSCLRPKKKGDKKKEKKAKKEVKVQRVESEEDEQMDQGEEHNEKENESEEEEGEEVQKVVKKKRIQVTKSVKETLMTLPRKERKKFLKELAAKKKPNLVLGEQCKQLWEVIRSGKTKKDLKEESVEKLIKLVKGKLKNLVYSHDTSRVIECLYKERREDVRNMIYDELFADIVKMSKSKYARFFVTKMIKYGSKLQRMKIMDAFRGHCVSMFRVSHSADVLELVFNDYASQQQRWDILSEFYGKEFVLFRTEQSRPIEKIVADEPSKKKGIVKCLEEIVEDIVGKTTIKSSLAHKLMLDLMTYGDREQQANLIDSIKDKLPEFIHTPDGSELAVRVVWNTSAKDRKLIVKNFKDLAVKAASDVHGCRTLMAIFDSVDDTVLVNKFITQEIANNVGTVCENKYGIRTAHYLVHPRDGRVMRRHVYSMLAKGDSNEHSKKPMEERYSELFRAFAPGLYTWMAANMEKLIFDQVETANLVLAALEPPGNKYERFERVIDPQLRLPCYEAMAELAKKEFVPCDMENPHLVEHKWANFVVSRLLKFDGALPEAERLSTQLAKLDSVQIASWVTCNKGCFTLLRMYENGSAETKKKVKSSVSVKKIKDYTSEGAKLLYKALTA